MINDYNYINGCNCNVPGNPAFGHSESLFVEGINTKNVITVTNNRAQYYAELAKQYKDEAKEHRDSAKYYSEQNSDVTKAYVDDNDAELQLAIDTKQDELVSGTNIKTVNSTSLLGSGNIDVATSTQGGKADTALQPNDNISQLTNDSGFITSSALSNLADYNLSNLTATGKNTLCGLLTPDYANGITVAASSSSEQSYTAPSIGWFNFTLWSQGNVRAYVMVNDYPYAIRGDNSGSTNTVYESITGSILVNKNDVIKFKTSKSVTDWGDYNYFYPAKGGN